MYASACVITAAVAAAVVVVAVAAFCAALRCLLPLQGQRIGVYILRCMHWGVCAGPSAVLAAA